MKTLTIVRHAKSSWDNPGLSDIERPLNERGERSAPVMGERMVKAGLHPDLIVSSPAVRARTTAEIIAEELDFPHQNILSERRLFHASVSEILSVVSDQDSDYDHLMIVGHNPGLTDLVNFLSPGLTCNLPTAGVVSFSIEQVDWDLSDRKNVKLRFHDYPKKRQDA